MIRSVLLICAGVIMATCFACAPAPRMLAASATCQDGTTFLSHVTFVQNGFDPSADPNDPPAANLGTPIGASSPYAQALQNAFNLAPPTFQTRLCGLTAIYVNGPATCSSLSGCTGGSWGYRPANASTKSFVAIAAGLWNQKCPGGITPYNFSCFESDVMDAVFGWDPSDSQAPRHGHANREAENFDMTILAALAHEVGHVRWYQVMNPSSPGKDYDPNTNSFCTTANTSFFSYSWVTPVRKPLQWHVFASFGSTGRDLYNKHLGNDPQISTIDGYVSGHDMAHAAPLLSQLYQNSDPWPSYFGAISPDEDFVETYKFYILTHAQDDSSSIKGHLTSLPMNFSDGRNSYSPDIPKDYFAGGGKPALHSKTSCIANII